VQYCFLMLVGGISSSILGCVVMILTSGLILGSWIKRWSVGQTAITRSVLITVKELQQLYRIMGIIVVE